MNHSLSYYQGILEVSAINLYKMQVVMHLLYLMKVFELYSREEVPRKYSLHWL